ncbi:unnamed protein product [Mucor circinelloides]|uniref:NodB homology domain-containing protein n=1 Tax=Mucor circinelloides f. circinelloides (strain 1006PhL) TaxID=1220926 RepID=S2K535_MUCC1|nr:hypothetical protein HMPREF1544_02677 [Mucor circinelloides 1006PhL]KAG1087145.1 hypothetical protein G6F42_020718 [Rhizopus arrhizus]
MVQLAIFSTIAASIALVAAGPINRGSSNATTTSTNATATSNGILATSSPAYLPSFPFHGITPLKPVPTGAITKNSSFKIADYPETWTQPDVNHPEVQAAIKAIDWAYVPKFKPRTEGMAYDGNKDEACWWTNTQCTTPKAKYLPADVKYCPKVGDFGLTYDDGPLPPTSDNDPWAEPRLYDFLASQSQTATLFYVGSNVAAFPEAAVRALESGHTICAHTWSHPQMTTLTNHEIVAQLYWNLRAIKEAAGVTPRCWRPPYGDVDDRVRAIAHQMGMSTIIWDSDSFDWGLPSVANDFAGTYTQATVDGFFKSWLEERKSGKDTHGHVVLEHETSNMTIVTTERWLPKLKEAFNVQKVHDCAPQLPSPYWEA